MKSYDEAIAAVVSHLTVDYELRYVTYAAVIVLSDIYGVERDQVSDDIKAGVDAYHKQVKQQQRQARIDKQNENIARKREIHNESR